MNPVEGDVHLAPCGQMPSHWLSEVDFVKIHGAVQDADNFNSVTPRIIEDEVATDNVTSQAGVKFRPRASRLRILSKHGEGRVDVVEHAIRRANVLGGDPAPYVDEVGLGARTELGGNGFSARA